MGDWEGETPPDWVPLPLSVAGMVGEEDFVGAEEALPTPLVLGDAEVECVGVGREVEECVEVMVSED